MNINNTPLKGLIVSEQSPVITSNNREQLIDSNEQLSDTERAILKKYFNNKSHGVSNKETNPLNLVSFGEPPTKMAPDVWVGNFYDAHSTALLTDLRFQCIISLMGQWPNAVMGGIPYYLYPIPLIVEPGKKLDEMGQNNVISAINMIERLRNAGLTPILLHCLEGKDRSPTITWKYMIEKLKKTEDDARATITRLRPISQIHHDWF